MVAIRHSLQRLERLLGTFPGLWGFGSVSLTRPVELGSHQTDNWE